MSNRNGQYDPAHYDSNNAYDRAARNAYDAEQRNKKIRDRIMNHNHNSGGGSYYAQDSDTSYNDDDSDGGLGFVWDFIKLAFYLGLLYVMFMVGIALMLIGIALFAIWAIIKLYRPVIKPCAIFTWFYIIIPCAIFMWCWIIVPISKWLYYRCLKPLVIWLYGLIANLFNKNNSKDSKDYYQYDYYNNPNYRDNNYREK